MTRPDGPPFATAAEHQAWLAKRRQSDAANDNEQQRLARKVNPAAICVCVLVALVVALIARSVIHSYDRDAAVTCLEEAQTAREHSSCHSRYRNAINAERRERQERNREQARQARCDRLNATSSYDLRPGDIDTLIRDC